MNTISSNTNLYNSYNLYNQKSKHVSKLQEQTGHHINSQISKYTNQTEVQGT